MTPRHQNDDNRSKREEGPIGLGGYFRPLTKRSHTPACTRTRERTCTRAHARTCARANRSSPISSVQQESVGPRAGWSLGGEKETRFSE